MRTFIASGDCFAMRAGHDGERALPQRRIELPWLRRRIESEAIERQHAVGPEREQRVVAHRDADRAVGAGPHDVGGLDARPRLAARVSPSRSIDDLAFGRLDLADVGGEAGSGEKERRASIGVRVMSVSV